MSAASQCPARQHGATLLVVLVMLAVVMMLGVAAAQLAISGERTSRNDVDREIAFQSAEAALADAEADIDGSGPSSSRSASFDRDSALGFPAEDEAVCNADGNTRGLCREDAAEPAWLAVDFLETEGANSKTVPLGTFTGRTLQTASGMLPSRLPRYIIERKMYTLPGANAEAGSYVYRITAVGFGMRDGTRVMLQTIFRKEQ